MRPSPIKKKAATAIQEDIEKFLENGGKIQYLRPEEHAIDQSKPVKLNTRIKGQN